MVAHGSAPDQGSGGGRLATSRGPSGWWAANRTEGHRAYFLVHIPKTAGESVGQDIHQVLPEQEGFYSSEQCLGLPRPMESGDVMVTFVREPVSHVYSLFLEQKYDLMECAAFQRTITVWLRDFDGCRTVPPYGCYSACNLQTRRLSCSPQDMDHTDLAQAVVNLGSFFFVGITEHYQASLCLFFAKTHVGQPLPPFCDCTNRAAWASFASVHETHGVPPHSLADLSREEVRMIEELTRLDALLHAFALERFRREAEEVERSTGTKILCED